MGATLSSVAVITTFMTSPMRFTCRFIAVSWLLSGVVVSAAGNAAGSAALNAAGSAALNAAGNAAVKATALQSPPAAGQSVQNDLSRAADVLLALKSTRFAVRREGTPAVLDESTGITFTAADCAYAAPDRATCNIRVALKNGTILQLTRVWVPEGAFQSNPLTRQFARLPPDATFNGSVLFARNGIPQILRTGIQKAQVVGRERIQNRDTMHVKGDVSGKTLNSLFDALSPDLIYPVDLWLDERTGDLVRLRVAEPAGNGWLIDLSGTNEPVDIPTPQVPAPAPGKP